MSLSAIAYGPRKNLVTGDTRRTSPRQGHSGQSVGMYEITGNECFHPGLPVSPLSNRRLLPSAYLEAIRPARTHPEQARNSGPAKSPFGDTVSLRWAVVDSKARPIKKVDIHRLGIFFQHRGKNKQKRIVITTLEQRPSQAIPDSAIIGSECEALPPFLNSLSI